MLLNVPFSDVPIEFTAATITIEIPAAMRAYSIAVAPVGSLTKRTKSFLMGQPSEISVISVARADTLWNSAFDRVNATIKNVGDASAEYPCA
jgi:hypothetical protein